MSTQIQPQRHEDGEPPPHRIQITRSAPERWGTLIPAFGKNALRVVGDVFSLDGVFDFHVAKLFGIKNFATIQALDEFTVFVAGYDTNPGVFAGGSHRSIFERK
ncbi:MAG: hypothetical protein WAL75_27385 [Terracidiphilus sp.]